MGSDSNSSPLTDTHEGDESPPSVLESDQREQSLQVANDALCTTEAHGKFRQLISCLDHLKSRLEMRLNCGFCVLCHRGVSIPLSFTKIARILSLFGRFEPEIEGWCVVTTGVEDFGDWYSGVRDFIPEEESSLVIERENWAITVKPMEEVMHDNNGEIEIGERKNKNKTNPRNHHLRGVCHHHQTKNRDISLIINFYSYYSMAALHFC